MNQFLEAVRQHDTYTENGAVSHSTTGSNLLDYFGKAGTYRGREQLDVDADISKIWSESPAVALQLIFYLRMISRKPKGFFTSDSVQSGQGVRDEFRKALSYLVRSYPEQLHKNLWLIPEVGCWKDLWHKDTISILDRDQVFELIRRGLSDHYHRELLAKYLPKIRSKRNTFNDRHRELNKFARELCRFLSWNDKQYRKFKSSGNAHQYQRDMCSNKWDFIDFSRIPGKALFQLVNKKGKDGKTTIERHNLENRYMEWIKSQPVAKFTGYIYELVKASNYGRSLGGTLSTAQKHTLDKQFEGLIQLGKSNNGGLQENVWCALDTSGSMMAEIPNTDITSWEVCIGLGIYFSALNNGAFKDHVIMFDHVSKVTKLESTFTDRLAQILSLGWARGGTNFQSVIDAIVRVRASNPNIPVEDYPTTLLVVSDMQFNPTGNAETNYETAMRKLRIAGLPEIKILWWQVNARRNDVPITIKDTGTTLISGFDGAIISTILGGDTTILDKDTNKIRKMNAYELMLKALNQDLLTQIKI